MQRRLVGHAHAARLLLRQKVLGYPVSTLSAAQEAIEASKHALPLIKCAVVSATTVTFFGMASSGVPIPPPVPGAAAMRHRGGQ